MNTIMMIIMKMHLIRKLVFINETLFSIEHFLDSHIDLCIRCIAEMTGNPDLVIERLFFPHLKYIHSHLALGERFLDLPS